MSEPDQDTALHFFTGFQPDSLCAPILQECICDERGLVSSHFSCAYVSINEEKKSYLEAATTKGEFAKLVERLSQRHPRPIVVKATGGYEGGLPVARAGGVTA